MVKEFVVDVSDGAMTIVCEGYDGSDVFEAGLEIMEGGDIDAAPPQVSVTKAVLAGTASDASGIQQLTVAGITVPVSGGGWTSQEVTLGAGTTTITIAATDGSGNTRTLKVLVSK